MATQGSPSAAKNKELRLPISRVKTIMKSSPYVETIGQDSLFLLTKATELFITHLTVQAQKYNTKETIFDYKYLAEVVQTDDKLEFLREIMPRKITVRHFKEMMDSKNSSSSSHSSSSESSSDSDSDSQSDSDSCLDSDNEKQENGKSSNSEEESENKENNKSDSASEKSESEEEAEETKRQ